MTEVCKTDSCRIISLKNVTNIVFSRKTESRKGEGLGSRLYVRAVGFVGDENRIARVGNISKEKLRGFPQTKARLLLADQITAAPAVQGFAILFLFPNDGLIDCFCIPPSLWCCSTACFMGH